MIKTILDTLATDRVGISEAELKATGRELLFFATNKEGKTVATFTDKDQAFGFGRDHDLLIEGPSGCEQESTWSWESEDDHS